FDSVRIPADVCLRPVELESRETIEDSRQGELHCIPGVLRGATQHVRRVGAAGQAARLPLELHWRAAVARPPGNVDGDRRVVVEGRGPEAVVLGRGIRLP